MSNTIVRTNVMALNSHRNLGMVGNQQNRASQRLSSGFRINSAADDAAGLGISEKMRSQIRGLDQASRNGQDGISLIQTAEGAMNTINEMVTRIRELVVQAANDTNASSTTNWSASDRTRIQAEINQLMDEIDATASRTQFNTRNLIDGSISGGTSGLWFQVGANYSQGVTLSIEAVSVGALSDRGGITGTFSFSALRTTGLASTSLGYGVIFTRGQDIQNFITALDNALAFTTEQRSNLGAMQNRLEFTIQNLDIASENLSNANSRIRDADMASEMMRLTQANVLQQAAISMLAQANQAPQSVLQLLG
ncbi:MAG: flagellin [Firmicutes bacterium]|nr:flagellin [Bacillota bacterium]